MLNTKYKNIKTLQHFLGEPLVRQAPNKLGMTKKEDISSDFKNYKVKNDNSAFQRIRLMINDTMNPFDRQLDSKNLYNLSTGAPASQKTEDFLQKNTEREKFIKECCEDPARFESRIWRKTLHIFATEGGKKKVTSTDGKIVTACLLRDLLGSILYLSLQRKVDMREVLRYPLTPVPLSLCHIDGSMQKSPKSMLLKFLDSKIVSRSPTSINVTIIDVMFFLHLHNNLPVTFGGVAQYLKYV